MKLSDTVNLPRFKGIYIIKNMITNQMYVGVSNDIKRRFEKHRHELKTNNHSNTKLQRSYNKYGVENFNVYIVEKYLNLDYEVLLKLEVEMIIKHNLLEKGFNLMIDNSKFLTNLNKSIKHIKSNIASTAKPVLCFDRKTGVFVKRFESVSDASRYLKTASSNVSRVCKNTLSYIKGHVLCYEQDYDINKDYSAERANKGKLLSDKHLKSLTLTNQKKFGTPIHKYDLNFNFIESYVSMGEAERNNNLNKESLRVKRDLETPFEGYYWKTTKL